MEKPSSDEKSGASQQGREEGPIARRVATILVWVILAALVSGPFLYRRLNLGPGLELRPDPYGSMVKALHAGMSGEEIVSAIGQPCRTILGSNGLISWTDLIYRKSDTQALLFIDVGSSGTINDWAILVPEGQPKSFLHRYPPAPKDYPSCFLGLQCSVHLKVDENGESVTGLSCATGEAYKAVREEHP